MVEETLEPGMTVSLVARRHGVAPNQLFTWRRLVAQGAVAKLGNSARFILIFEFPDRIWHWRVQRQPLKVGNATFGLISAQLRAPYADFAQPRAR